MSRWAERLGRRRTLHQFLTGATAGDAITNQALIMRDWLHDLGFHSNLYAQHIHESMRDEVQPLTAYRRSRGETQAIYHHSIGSEVAPFLQQHGPRLILIHHNVTPAHFFTHVNPAWARRARLGGDQLRVLCPHVDLALADSAFNELELLDAGYKTTGVLPIVLDTEQYNLPDNDSLARQLQEMVGPILLFVGRLAPNKKQEDLVKLLYCYHRFRPSAHLVLVGDRWDMGYDGWVERLAHNLGLADAVTLTGKVSQQDMVTYYRHADLYVSMSEHEGFGKPLVESMYLGLPILAYAATSVPYTLGAAGVKFHEKKFEHLAELADILIEDDALRTRIVTAQQQKVQEYLEPQVRRQFIEFLEQAQS